MGIVCMAHGTKTGHEWTCFYKLYHLNETSTLIAMVIQVRSSNNAAATSSEEYDEEWPEQCIVNNPCHVFILRISRVFGLSPLKFERRSNGYGVTISNAMCVYRYFIATLVGIFLTLWLAAKIRHDIKINLSTDAWHILSTINILLVTMATIIGICDARRRMRRMFKFMETLGYIDTMLGSHYSALTGRKLVPLLLTSLLMFIGLFLCECYLSISKYNLNKWIVTANVIHYLLRSTNIVFELEFAVIVWLVRARFQEINNTLSLTVRRLTLPVNRNLEAGVPPCEAIGRLVSLHSELCNVIQRIDHSYGLPLIIILTTIVLNLLLISYFMIMEIIAFNNSKLHLVIKFVRCISILARMFLILEAGHRASAEGMKTTELICQMIKTVSSRTIPPSTIEQFSRQLMLHTVCFSPIGVCTLNRSLMLSILGSVVTYLFVLIQM